MAKVKIQGNASGTGILTVTAPNTSTDRTITLPDATGTLFTDAGGTMTGNLTVGTTSVADPVLLIQSSGSGDSQLNFSSAAANRSGKIRFLDNGSAVGGFINYVHNGDKMEFGSGSSTTVGFRVADGYSNAAQGLTFGSDTADANKLDDYEEGTWQPSFVAGSGSVTAHASYSLCRYTKIGRVVQISGLVSCSGVSSPSGSLQMHGLPFAVNNNTSGEASGNAAIAVGNIIDLASSVYMIIMRPEVGTSYITIENFNGTTSVNTADKWQNGTYFTFSGAYTV